MENLSQQQFTNHEEANNNIPPTSIPKSNFSKIKWIGVGVLLTLALIGIFIFVWFSFQKISLQKNIVQDTNQPSQTQTPSSTPNIDSGVWKIELANEETKTASNLIENYLIYATKNEYKVIVYKKNLQNGSQTKILEYNESLKATKSGNLWEGLPPNIALSPNKKQLAFIDQEGLKVLDLQANSTKVLIRQTNKPSNEEAPPQWSINSLSGTYSLARPKWSSDNRYISFLQSHYEGASFGLIDYQTGQYFSVNLGGGYRNLTWSPTTSSFVKPMYGGYEGTGLYISASDITKEATDLSSKFGKQGASFFEVNYSTDGQKLVFSYSDNEETENTTIAIVNIDGTGFAILDEKGKNQMPFFSTDGEFVFYVQNKNGQQVLIKYDLAAKKASDFAVLPSGFNSWRDMFWTKDNFLALVGISSSSGLTVGGDNTRMVILDIQNKRIIYASPVFDQFTNFAGLSN